MDLPSPQASENVLSVLAGAKFVLAVTLLTLFWSWETWRPLVGWRISRLKHGVRNLVIGTLNAILLAIAFGASTTAVTLWTANSRIGLLHLLELNWMLEFTLAILLLDGWMYLWHRANHVIPFLWRFHRMHHSDNRMDVTTAIRFHVGEHLGSAVLRLGLIPLFGLQLWHLVVYELLVIAVTQFHHANISLGRFDRWIRLLVVTPDMHKLHHSRVPVETNANFSTVFSAWDRLAQTFRMRTDVKTIEYGLDGFDEPRWQTLPGMLKTPLVSLNEKNAGDELQAEQPWHAPAVPQRHALVTGEKYE